MAATVKSEYVSGEEEEEEAEYLSRIREEEKLGIEQHGRTNCLDIGSRKMMMVRRDGARAEVN